MSDADVAGIAEIIRNWPVPLMPWDGEGSIRAEIGRKLLGRKDGSDEGVWSRQALTSHPAIERAYDERTTELEKVQRRGTRRKRKPAPDTVLWQQRVDHLESRIRQLEAKLGAYEELFRTYNVRKFRGAATEEELAKPLESKPKRGGGE